MKHEIHLFKVLLSLKVVKFDTKMYLNFSNFRGRTSAGGGDKPWSKNGDKCRMGDWQNFRRMGGPPSPPRKKTLGIWFTGEVKGQVLYQIRTVSTSLTTGLIVVLASDLLCHKHKLLPVCFTISTHRWTVSSSLTPWEPSWLCIVYWEQSALYVHVLINLHHITIKWV